MGNGNMPAMPSDHTYIDDDINCREMHTGLTKREHFAGLAMQGLLSAHKGFSFSDTAKTAVGIADELLKELDK